MLTFVQITEGLKPTTFQVFNDSHKHSHHQAMQGVTSREVWQLSLDWVETMADFS
jgi:stress-induced morphogen